METAILNGIIISNGQFVKNKAVIVKNGYINSILNEEHLPQNIERIDAEGAYISPGFIDLQVMGADGALYGSLPSETALKTMENALLKQGVIGFLPTVSTNSDEITEKAVRLAAGYREKAIGNFLGLHLEGPYINPENRGAHPSEYIQKASLQSVRELLNIAKGEIKMMTLAPELQDKEVIDCLMENSVVVALGHSGADYEEAMDFFSGSKKAVTHLFNGMPQIHHRKPGLIPAIFREKPYTSIVADGIHVAYPMIRMAKEILGESLYLISDAATPATEGVYKHTLKGDRYVAINKNNEEVLSGSALTMLKAVQNCVEHVGISLPEAVNMATLYPARVIGAERRIGLIQPGYEASMVLFDHNYNITRVIYKGRNICY